MYWFKAVGGADGGVCRRARSRFLFTDLASSTRLWEEYPEAQLTFDFGTTTKNKSTIRALSGWRKLLVIDRLPERHKPVHHLEIEEKHCSRSF